MIGCVATSSLVSRTRFLPANPQSDKTALDSALITGLGSPSLFHVKSTPSCKLSFNPPPPFPISKPFKPSTFTLQASPDNQNAIVKSTAGAIIFTAALMISKFQQYPARAEPPPVQILTEEEQLQDKSQDLLSEFLDSNSEAVHALKTLLQQKLEAGEDEQSLKILKKLVSAQPENLEWKFLIARVFNEMGQTQEARTVFEEILSKNPLSFEALFENAILMDRCGEGEAVIKRLEEALHIAEEEKKVKEARDVKLIMAQVQFLQKNVEEALRTYDQLAREDPTDFRPYFCKGMIFSLMDKNNEAREQFAKYRELSPKKFEVEGYLRSPLSKMKLFGADDDDEN